MKIDKKKVLFIINPLAGVDRVKAIQKAIDQHLDTQKMDYEIAYTEYAQHGTEIARQAATDGFDIVVAVGGDGSVNDIIHGIYGTSTLLGIIPKGSGNGLARSLKIPLSTSAAIQTLNDLHPTSIDIGKANEHLFASNAGVGFDTEVTLDFKHNTRRGFLAYTGIVLKNLTSYQPRTWQLTTPKKSWTSKSFMLTVANANQLGYGFQIAPEADLTDGQFELVHIRPFPLISGTGISLRAFAGSLHKSRFVSTEKIKEITIQHPDLKHFQVDGESLSCEGRVHIQVMPKQLGILTPR